MSAGPSRTEARHWSSRATMLYFTERRIWNESVLCACRRRRDGTSSSLSYFSLLEMEAASDLAITWQLLIWFWVIWEQLWTNGFSAKKSQLRSDPVANAWASSPPRPPCFQPGDSCSNPPACCWCSWRLSIWIVANAFSHPFYHCHQRSIRYLFHSGHCDWPRV